MLRLASETPTSWVSDVVVPHLTTVLVDHAHCEKKAASTAVSLLFRHPDVGALLRPLSALAREELEHFEAVLDRVEIRGARFDRLEPAPYAARLHKVVRRGEPFRLFDTLLACALIEARSCERMKLLSEHLPDPELAAFYGELLASEARHFRIYLDLAADVLPDADVGARLDELAAHEAQVLALPAGLPRLHSATG